MVPHMVYFDILVTIRRQFINVQYRDTTHITSRKYGPYKGYLCKYRQSSYFFLYFQCYNPISYSGHPRVSKIIGSLRLGVGCTRVISASRPLLFSQCAAAILILWSKIKYFLI